MNMLTNNADTYMDIKNILEQFGLSKNQSAVYLAVLELGSATVIEIAKKARIKRTTCYDILLDLKDKGLVSETSKAKRRLFVGEDPEEIQKQLKAKQQVFSEILPQLKSIYNISGTKPKIRYYEGKDGLRKVYDDTLAYPNSTILAFNSEDMPKILGMDWVTEYIGNRVANNITEKEIIPKTEYLVKHFLAKDPQHKRISKLIDVKKYPFSIEIDIYGHQKVALMSVKEEMGIIIEGKEIHNTMKHIFELLWDTLPEISKKQFFQVKDENKEE